jgi:hypothetical protein
MNTKQTKAYTNFNSVPTKKPTKDPNAARQASLLGVLAILSPK